MLCPSCGSPVSRGIPECPQCGAAVYAKDRAVRVEYQQSAEKRRHDESMVTAQHEQRKYGLAAQFPGESDEAFCMRINSQKTPGVLAELNRMAVHASESTVAREPGEDG